MSAAEPTKEKPAVVTRKTCSGPGSRKNPACEVLTHLRLNLLTGERKEALRLHLLFVTMRDVLLILLVECLILGTVMLAGSTILERTFEEAVRQSVGITRTFSGNNREIQTINDEVSALQKIQTQAVPVGDVYGGVAALVPPGITLYSLSLDFTAKRVRFQGVARTRDNLNKLHEALATSELLSGLESPLSNLFVKNDIPFEFSAGLTLEGAKTPLFSPLPTAPTAAASSTL